MRDAYRCAHRAGLTIDHIVPLSGGIVSGLHVPWNLAAIAHLENQKKGSKWWPDSPFSQGELSL